MGRSFASSFGGTGFANHHCPVTLVGRVGAGLHGAGENLFREPRVLARSLATGIRSAHAGGVGDVRWYLTIRLQAA